MTRRFIGSLTAVAALVILALLPAQSPVAAQAAQAAKPASRPAPPAPRLPNGKPDFSGVLMGGGGVSPRALKPGDTLTLLPEAKKLMDSRLAVNDPEANCLPGGVPRMNPYPWRMVQSIDGKYIWILFEGNIHSYRQIFLDGRKHLPDPDPTWYGNSIGSWDGDTLVVDTVAFNDRFWFGANGLPHTTKLHTIERFRRPDSDTLLWDITIDDPGAYAKPFTVQTKAVYHHDWELMEYICQENETSASAGHIKGKANAGTSNGGQ
jgi:hypothetical protein